MNFIRLTDIYIADYQYDFIASRYEDTNWDFKILVGMYHPYLYTSFTEVARWARVMQFYV